MKKKLTVALAAAALAVLPMTAASADGHATAQVTVVHGIPGADGVSILADGGALLSDVDFKDVVTTDLPAGTYSLAVSTSDSEDDIILGPLDVTVAEGGLYAVVAHLDADGAPTVTPFAVNDAEGVSAFHTAAFVPVAIVAGGEIAADNIANGESAQIDAPAGTELPDVGVAAAGSTDIALPVGDVTLPENQRILVFAVGTPDDDTLQLLDPVIVDITTTPGAVHSPGDAGLASTTMPALVIAMMLLGAMALAAPVVARKRS